MTKKAKTIDDVFVQPYLRGQEPLNITVAGKLPIRNGDYKIYNAPYSLIKHQLYKDIEGMASDGFLANEVLHPKPGEPVVSKKVVKLSDLKEYLLGEEK